MVAQLSLSPSDIISIVNDEPRTTSLKVAEVFGKLHKDVLRKIENLDCSPEFAERNFTLCHKNNELQNGKPQPYHEMTKDGFMFLVMGFTGEKAAQVKEAYIAAFNWMADRLRGTTPAAILPPPRQPGAPLLFNGVPVMTMAQLTAFFDADRATLTGNLHHFPGRFVAGVHYFKLAGDILRTFALDNLHTGHVGRKNGRELLIWSFDGVREHALCLPGRYSANWQRRWADYVDGPQADEPTPYHDNPRPAAAGSAMTVMLTFTNATALGAAMPDLLTLTSRHAVSLRMEGGAA